jgi:hypothetical protein
MYNEIQVVCVHGLIVIRKMVANVSAYCGGGLKQLRLVARDKIK